MAGLNNGMQAYDRLASKKNVSPLISPSLKSHDEMPLFKASQMRGFFLRHMILDD